MEINITCVLQIVHFLIGWLILDRFYFRPALAWLNSLHMQERLAHKRINEMDHVLSDLHKQEQALKQDFMHYCATHKIDNSFYEPALIAAAQSSESLQHYQYTDQEIAQIQRDLKASIIKKVLQ